MPPCPSYLADFADLWADDPHAATLAWWRTKARWGLFMHYGLYSQLQRGEWVLFLETIPLAEYEALADTFAPDHFDAEAIADMACDAGMDYINLTSCHHEGFCLWGSAAEPFNSVTACGRDLVRELAAACEARGLGLFLYFTYALNWRHPYAATRDMFFIGRPDYAEPQPRYQLTSEDEFARFWEWSHSCIRELCELEYPLAGIWLDIIAACYIRPDLVPVEETYRLIRSLRPEVLISYKQGATGTEDFASPEFHFNSLANAGWIKNVPGGAERARQAWELNRHKRNEICLTLQKNGWGVVDDSPHKSADEVWGCLAYATAHNCSLLVNTGPLPGGSIHPEDVQTLRAVGERLRRDGWPEPDPDYNPAEAKGAGGA